MNEHNLRRIIKAYSLYLRAVGVVLFIAAPVLDPNEKFTCIQCGFVFTSRWHQLRWAVLAGLAAVLLLVVVL